MPHSAGAVTLPRFAILVRIEWQTVAAPLARNSVTRNIVYKTLGTVVEKALKLLIVPLIARTLGARVYGQYSYAVTVAALTLYDMIKAIDKAAVIRDVRLLAKSGGKSGPLRPHEP